MTKYYEVYAKAYDKLNLIPKGSFRSIENARKRMYSLLKKDGFESAIVCFMNDNRQIGGVRHGDFIYERGKVFYYSDYWGKKLLGLKFNKYILHNDGTLGAGKM